MGLIKKFADYAGVKHEIDPTGHSHTTSESWLSTIVNNLTTLINGKAASVHTHASITDGAASVTAMNDRGSHIIRINATGVDGSAVDADHAVEDSDNLITSGAVYSDLAGKAPLSNPDFTGRVYCQSGHFNEVYGDNDNGIKITPDIDSDYGVYLENDGAVTIDGESVSGTAVDSTPTANSNKLVKSSGVATALAGKANSSHTHTQSNITGLTAALAGKANSSHTHSQSDVTGLATSLEGKVDANVDDTYGSVDTDHKINVTNLVNGKMYRAYAADAFDGIAIRDMFNHTGSTVSFNNWVDDSTSVFMLLFRYYKLPTSIEGRYTHVVDIVKYDIPTGPM